MDRNYGLRVSVAQQWVMGKTAASIHFVDAAEQYITLISAGGDVSPADQAVIDKLRTEIDRVKDGTTVYITMVTVDDYLKMGASPGSCK